MMMMIEDHHTKDQNQRSKNIMRMGQGSWIKGSWAKPSKKGGSGGGPKNRQILHTGGEIWGGPFLGGSRNKGS